MTTGRIIFLNGSSSAGKTTLALALQERLPELYLHIALDQFRDALPTQYRGLNAPAGTTGADGLNVVPVHGDGQAWTRVSFGPQGQKMLRGMRRAIAAMARAGTHVIVDDIILEPEFLDDYLDVLADLEVIFVGVKCPATVVQARENARPGRFPGTALGHLQICHAHGLYDLQVDTHTSSPQECARQVESILQATGPRAFTQLRQQRTDP